MTSNTQALQSSVKRSSILIHVRSLLWLIGALIMVVIAILLWMYSKSAIENNTTETTVEESVASVAAINVSKRINNLDDLGREVAPIEFETIVRDMRNYPDEFVDKSYLTKNTEKWTLQVMDVEEHDIISDYLQSREDRDQFAYFRYSDSNSQLRYILTYGLVTDLKEAMELMSEKDFNLPQTVEVVPEEVTRYLSIIDNYERAEQVLDMSRNRPRSIRLFKTRREVPVRRTTAPKPAVDTKAIANKFRPKTTTKTVTTTKKQPVDNNAKVTEKEPIKPVTEEAVRKSLQESKNTSINDNKNNDASNSNNDTSNDNTSPSKVTPAQPVTDKTATDSTAPKPKATTEASAEKLVERKPKPFVPNQPPTDNN